MTDPELKSILALLDAIDKLASSSPAIKTKADEARKAIEAADAPDPGLAFGRGSVE